MNNISELTDATFTSEVLESDIPAVVDFWAPWCAPCRMVAPVLEAVAENMNGKMKFFKLNTDENLKTAQGYGIMAIPSLLVFKKGQEVERIIGFLPQDKLEEKLQSVIGSAQADFMPKA
jgi:thioredoxin 1